MRLFVGGSNGLVFYEDEELTPLHSEPILCMVKATPSRLVAGTESGAVLVLEGGNGGAAVSAKDVGDALHGMAVTGKGNLLAGTEPAGLWVSKDHGETWRELPAFAAGPNCDGWMAPWGTPLVSAIACHPKDSKTIFCGVEVGGLYRTRDSGRTWFDLEIPCPDVHSVQVSPARPERVYASTGGGFYSSDDEGFSWRHMGGQNPHQYTMGLSAHPVEAERVIISAAKGPPPTWTGKAGAGCEVYLSTDGGSRFRRVAKGLRGAVRRRALLINQKVPSEVIFGTSTGELYYSNDGGESFDLMASALGDIRTLIFA